MSRLPQQIAISEYNYDLPEARIAKFPLERRDASKLLVYRKGEITHDVFTALPRYLPGKSLLIFNNTKVIQARLHFRKETGALIEIFCLEPWQPSDYPLNFQQTEHCAWLCMVGNLKKWKEGILSNTLTVRGLEVTLTAERKEVHGTSHRIDFRWNAPSLTFADILEAFGQLPIPPYLNRETQESDQETYQTVYSKVKGSVAAPTAGLHFTPQVMQSLQSEGVELEEVTLHVGAGTFRPVKSRFVEDHPMHTEFFSVSKHTLQRLIAHQAQAIAVGTTSVRTLESLYHLGVKLSLQPDVSPENLHINQWEAYEHPLTPSGMEALTVVLNYMNRHELEALHASTQILIAPGYEYRVVKAIITNFHQPQSTLLLLVSAFLNGKWKEVYDYALKNDFRFLSYGDSSLLLP